MVRTLPIFVSLLWFSIICSTGIIYFMCLFSTCVSQSTPHDAAKRLPRLIVISGVNVMFYTVQNRVSAIRFLRSRKKSVN